MNCKYYDDWGDGALTCLVDNSLTDCEGYCDAMEDADCPYQDEECLNMDCRDCVFNQGKKEE